MLWRQRFGAPVAVAVLAAATTLTWSWRPSYWYDEAATLSGAERSPAELWDLARHVDLVHAGYYYAMMVWIDVAGRSEFATRAFSAVGLVATCVGVVEVGRRLGGARLGALAGGLCALLPGFAWAGAEARGYSWAAAAVVLWALMFLRAQRTQRSRDLVWYAAAMVLAVHVFVISVLMAPAFVLTSVLWRGRTAALVVASAIGTALCVPFLLAAKGQDEALGWSEQSPAMMLGKVVGRQYFLSPRGPLEPGAVWAAAVVLAGACGLLAWAALRSRDVITPRSRVLALTLPWILVPTATLVLWSLVVRPIYTERYTTFTAPGLALLLAYGLLQLGARWRAVAGGAVVVLCLVVLVSQREVGSKAQDNYRALADAVGHQRHPATVVFGTPAARGVALAYPASFAGVRQPNAARTGPASGSLWGTVRPLSRLGYGEVATGRGSVVLLDRTVPRWTDTALGRWLHRHGCRLTGRTSAARFTAYHLRCRPPAR